MSEFQRIITIVTVIQIFNTVFRDYRVHFMCTLNITGENNVWIYHSGKAGIKNKRI